MGYTQDDITAAVGQLLNANIRYPVDQQTGGRQIATTFNDVQETAAATFVMFPEAMLHVAELSARMLITSMTSYQAGVVALISAVGSVNRQVDDAQAIAPMANMSSALIELDGVVSNGRYSGLQSIPSYQRFIANASSFLSVVKPAIVVGGDVVPSKRQVVASLPNQVAALPGAFSTVWHGSRNFAAAVSNYQSLNLPTVLVQNVVSRANALLLSQHTDMSGMSVEQQQALLYDATLSVLSTKGLLGLMESFSPPPEQYDEVSGTIYAYADANHPVATVGSVTASSAGPYFFRYGVSDSLYVQIDNSPTANFHMVLPAISSTYLEGSVPAPYVFDLGDVARIDNTIAGDYTFATDQNLKFLLEATVNGVYQSWTIDFPIAAGVHTVIEVYEGLSAFILAQTSSTSFTAITLVGAVAFSIISTVLGANYKITMLDGSANSTLGFQTGASSVGRSRNDQLLVTYKSALVTTPINFIITFPTGAQTIDQAVAVINSSRPPQLVNLLHAEPHQYLVGGGTKTFCRLVVDDLSVDADMVVTGAIVTGQVPNSGIGLGGEVTHLPITTQRTADFINAFPPASTVPPPTPPPKFSDYAVADVVTDQTGKQYLRISSKNKNSSATEVLLQGTAVAVMFGQPQAVGLGTSKWYRMSDSNPVITVGDIIELHDTDVNDATVQSVTSDGLLYTDLPMEFYRSYQFGHAGAYYAVAVRGDRKSFEQVIADETFQQFLSNDHSSFFSNLNRYTNMMLADKNPTEAEINIVLGELSTHLAELTYVIALLSEFHAYPCPAVDRLFKLMNEKGSDRAVDTLLQCQFSEFFGLNVDTSSYAGTVMSGLRTVVQQDLPVAKFDRPKGGRSVISAAASADYDSDLSDVAPDDSKYNIDKV
jgi:hypothetical protein